MNRLQKYLLENKPQIWNTRLVWMALAIAIIHVLFYISGYAYYDDIEKLKEYSYGTLHVRHFYSMSFSILISILLLLLWLVHYLRNNPFKSFYPLKKGYFFFEFSIVLLIIFGSITFYKSYSKGYWDHVERANKDIDLVSEINTINLGIALLPSDSRNYTIRASCDSLDYKDALENLRNDTLLSKEEHRKVVAAIDSFTNADQRDNHYSYLHYCSKYATTLSDLTYSKYEINDRLNRWLSGNQKDSVRLALNNVQDLCKRYKVLTNVPFQTFTDTVFSQPDFVVRQFVTNNEYGYYEDDYVEDNTDYTETVATATVVPDNVEARRNLFHLNFSTIDQCTQNIQTSRTRQFDFAFWLVNLYVALAFALLLFTFRSTSLKTWFIAAVGSGIVSVAFGIVAVFVSHETGITVFTILLFLGFYMLYHFLAKRNKKLWAGVNLIWFTWVLPYLWFLLHNLAERLTRPETIRLDNGTYYTPESPTYDFLHSMEVPFFYLYFVLTFILITTVIYRHFRQWMAMAEE